MFFESYLIIVGWKTLSTSISFRLQSWTFAYIWLFNKPYENEVTLRGQNIRLKCYQPLELMLYFGKGLKSFHRVNLGSVGQRASKLLAVKVGVFQEKVCCFGHSSLIVCKRVQLGFKFARGQIILKV